MIDGMLSKKDMLDLEKKIKSELCTRNSKKRKKRNNRPNWRKLKQTTSTIEVGRSIVDVLNKKNNSKSQGKDNIRPNHYKGKNGMEVMDVQEAFFSLEQFRGGCKSNILKYLLRADEKNGVEDYKKIPFYLDNLIKTYEEE